MGCFLTSLKYEGVGKYLDTMFITDGDPVSDDSTDLHNNSDFISTSVEITSAYGVRVADLSADLNVILHWYCGLYPRPSKYIPENCLGIRLLLGLDTVIALWGGAGVNGAAARRP